MEFVNPLYKTDWDELLLSSQGYSFFHSSGWARVLSEAYNYNPLYFSLIKDGKFKVALPLMEIKSILTGKRAVSLPFSDYCEPMLSEDVKFQDVFDSLVRYGSEAGWKYIEIRDGKYFSDDVVSFSHFYGHTLSLLQSEEDIFSNFKSNTKRNIKKANRENVTVSRNDSIESVNEFYRLNCMTRKTHGLPPQPYHFFQKLHEHVISKGGGNVFLASIDGKNTAGAVYLHFGKKALYKYGASDKKYQHLRTNNVVMWEAIKYYAKKGYESFYFGRTEPENEGLMKYKDGWGAKKHIIKYYRYDLHKKMFKSEDGHVSKFSNKLFEKMPVPLLKFIGSLLYRHVG